MKRSIQLVIAAVIMAACHDAPTPSGPLVADLGVVNLSPVAVPGGPYLADGLVRFDGTGSLDPDGDQPLTYAWDFGDGQRGTGATTTHAYAADGVYPATLIVTDAKGAVSVPTPALVTITGAGGPAAVLAGAGNIARCATTNDEATALVLDGIPGTVVALGDNALPNGRPVDYQNCYNASWGRHLNRTMPAIGNHEYDSSATAAGAFGYFGTRAGPAGLGYYSADVGQWHIIVLNDNAAFVPYAAGSAQDQWLQADLAANSKPCTLAMWHTPLFLSSNTAGYTVNPSRKILWDRLAAAGVDVVLNGHQHHYERMAPMTSAGARDDATGIRQFNVGTGGDGLALPTVEIHPNSEVREVVLGVLKLTLRATRYDWEFEAIAGQTFRDAGSGTCH